MPAINNQKQYSRLTTDVLIIGAGVAGLSAAAALTAQGADSLLVEASPFPGGRAADFSCKATEVCAKCNACLLEESLAAGAGPGSRLFTGSRVFSVALTDEGGRAWIRRQPSYLEAELCLNCGRCFEACPAAGAALIRSPLPFRGARYAVDSAACRRFQGEACQACAEVCPTGAFNWQAIVQEEEVIFKALILAAGYTPFDPRLKPRYGYGRLPNVLTALELDRRLRLSGDLPALADEVQPQRLAFIQCVGSRDKSINRDYCSRVCCGYALRLARSIKHRWPDTHISFFYMDIQNPGRNFPGFYGEATEEIELIHGVPGELERGEGGSILVPFVGGTSGGKEIRSFDLVVLSVGLGPPDPALCSILDLAADEDGFPVGRPDKGLFVAGAASGPKSIAESKAWAEITAAEALRYIQSR